MENALKNNVFKLCTIKKQSDYSLKFKDKK